MRHPIRQNKKLPALLIAVGVFNFADHFITKYALSQGHVEINPVVNLLLPTPYHPYFKLIAVPGLLLFIWAVHRRISKKAILFAWLMFLSYSALMLYFAIGFLLGYL